MITKGNAARATSTLTFAANGKRDATNENRNGNYTGGKRGSEESGTRGGGNITTQNSTGNSEAAAMASEANGGGGKHTGATKVKDSYGAHGGGKGRRGSRRTAQHPRVRCIEARTLQPGHHRHAEALWLLAAARRCPMNTTRTPESANRETEWSTGENYFMDALPTMEAHLEPRDACGIIISETVSMLPFGQRLHSAGCRRFLSGPA
jgi:hypothetical protein